MRGKIRSFIPKLASVIPVALLLGLAFVQPTLSAGPLDTPLDRPPLPQPQPGGNGGGSGDEGKGPPAALNCAGVRGVVMNWGYQHEPGVALQLEGGGYQVSQVSASDGRYDFRGLGQGYAVLKPSLTVGQVNLKVHTDEVAIPLRCGFDSILNVGLYSGDKRPRPPAYLSLAADETRLQPGDIFRLVIKVRNTLPTGISSVIVTDLFPAFIKVKGIDVTKGQAEVADGRMLSIYVGNMDSGEEMTATVTLEVTDEARTGQRAVNRTTLLYAESMADQIVSTFTVGEKVAFETGYEPSLVASVDSEEPVEGTGGVPLSEPPVAKAKLTSDTAVSVLSVSEMPDDKPDDTEAADTINARLPVTGGGLEWLKLLLLGTGLAAIAFLAKALRSKMA